MTFEAFAHENTPAAAFGEMEPIAEVDDTPEFWAAQSAEFAEWERVEAEYRAEMDADYWADSDPSPYEGNYSEM